MSLITPPQYPIAERSAGHAPLRRPGSVRRTTTIDSEWPEGARAPLRMTGRARDLLTPFSGEPVILAEGAFEILASPVREILEIAASPPHPGISQLVGIRGGGASRGQIEELLADIQHGPLYQLLDDYAGASLVAAWIWSQWDPDWAARVRSAQVTSTAGRGGKMENVCTGFATGSSALAADGGTNAHLQSSADVGPLEHPDDPQGWHAMPAQGGRPQGRRARRIDLWRDGDLICVDAGFQDSGTKPAGGRRAVHEYRVYAEVETATGRLASVQALPLILPFPECPGAAVKVARMVGADVRALRGAVIERLPMTFGCTHLNDVIRALADVPSLAANLPK